MKLREGIFNRVKFIYKIGDSIQKSSKNNPTGETAVILINKFTITEDISKAEI